MLIRVEEPGDERRIREIQALAFRRPDAPDEEPVEAGLVDDLRRSEAWIPELSLVALLDRGPLDDELVGHVVCSRAHVLPDAPVLGLGPIGVHPDHQGAGIGRALVYAVLDAADARGEPLVALLGSPAFYGRFGFVRSTEHGIDPPDDAWGDHFQVRTLASYDGATAGRFRYAQPFQDL